MGKSIEDQLQDAIKKKEKLLKAKENLSLQIRENDSLIKSLQKQKKQVEGENILHKIEASGFTIEDVLKTMEMKHKKEDE